MHHPIARGLSLSCFLLFASFAAGQGRRIERFPAGPARDVLDKACTSCHAVTRISGQRMSPDEWRATVERMMSYGAQLTAAEKDSVISYVSQNFAGQPDQTPIKLQPSNLSLADARNFSGVYMPGEWYVSERFGPRGNLPRSVPLHGSKSRKSIGLLLTDWSKKMLSKYSIYDDAHAHCGAIGPQAYMAPYAFEFLHTPGRITLLMEEFHEVRRIWMDQEHPQTYDYTPLGGHSTGKWDGDTLVVDTVGFLETGPRGETSTAMYPHSDQRHLIERMRRVLDGRILEVETIDEDPVAFKEPLRSVTYFIKDDKLGIVYHSCEGAINYSPHDLNKTR
jgi:hypothetical protein